MAFSPSLVLGPNFTLGEFPCWDYATAEDVGHLTETVDRVLQPVRDRWGPVVPTSWMRWRDGCALRQGAHGQGGTVDFIVPGANLRTVFDWGVAQLVPLGYLGRWIYEPTTTDQNEHIHAAPVADMLAAFNKGDRLAFVETQDGEYAAVGQPGPWGGHTGSPTDPIPIPGVDVTVAGPGRLLAWVFLGLLLGGIARSQD